MCTECFPNERQSGGRNERATRRATKKAKAEPASGHRIDIYFGTCIVTFDMRRHEVDVNGVGHHERKLEGGKVRWKLATVHSL